LIETEGVRFLWD